MSIISSNNIVIERANAPKLHLPDFAIEKNQQALLLGPSGSGKTTLLSVLAGLLKPASGAVLFEGQDLYTLSSNKIDQLRGKHFGLIFQTLHLLPTLTIKQNIEIAAKLRNVKLKSKEIDDLLISLGLSEKAKRKPDALSQGEQQRAAIARAVITKPSIIFADEPTSALDDENAGIVANLLIQSAKDAGATLVIATHDARLMPLFSNVIHLNTSKDS